MTTTATQRPAILGGEPAVTLDHTEANRWPIITDDDEQAVLRVLRSGRISIHEDVAALEADYRNWLGGKHAVAHNNGTGAILAALHAFGLGPGDEVIVPAATWWSSVVPVLHTGAVPVFAETESQSLGLDPADVERRITARTRAIVVVHLFGMPSRMDELIDVARRHNLKILEDASHAHGATYRGRPIGTLTEAAVFSMQGNKLVPAGEGGMFVTNDDDLHERVIRFGQYERLLGLESKNRRFAATGFGFKFRMSPLNAAVARVQLRHLDERNAVRSENIRYLSRTLQAMGFETYSTEFTEGEDAATRRVYFEYLIRYEPQRMEGGDGPPMKALVNALQAEGAQVQRPRYPLLHQQPLFTEGRWAQVARLPIDPTEAMKRYDPADLPQTSAANGSLLKLPSFPNADRGLLDQYAQAFAKVLAHANDLPRDAD